MIDAFAARVADGLSRWPDADRAGVHVIFTAHSLPERVSRTATPTELSASDRAARRRGCGARRRTLVVELSVRGADSRALGRDQTSASISRLNARGVSGVVVVPVGFVSDHVELLFDVDVKARAVADELGMRLERPPALNDDPVFIEALAELVRGRTG